MRKKERKKENVKGDKERNEGKREERKIEK